MTVQIFAGGATDVGKKRENNEDALVADDALGVWVVCDGIGGSRGGEVAARLAADAVREAIAADRKQLDAQGSASTSQVRVSASAIVERAVQRACAVVYEAAQKDRKLQGMATTLDCLVRVGARAVIGHVGDSRVYLVRKGKAYQLTEDHTMGSFQVKAGFITPEQAKGSPMAGVLTRSVGGQRSVHVDTLVVDLLPDDVYVLCSDGLHRYLEGNDLAARVVGAAPDAVASSLVRFANDAGGQDNVTAVVLSCRAGAADADAGSAMARANVLSTTPLMRHLTYREQAAVLAMAETREYGAGATIVREGEASSDLYVVVSGQVEVSVGGQKVAALGAGGQFGEMSLVDQTPRSATVSAVVATQVLVLGHAPMMQLMRADSVLGLKILWTLAQGLSAKLRQSSAVLVDFQRELAPSTVRLPFG